MQTSSKEILTYSIIILFYHSPFKPVKIELKQGYQLDRKILIKAKIVSLFIRNTLHTKVVISKITKHKHNLKITTDN